MLHDNNTSRSELVRLSRYDMILNVFLFVGLAAFVAFIAWAEYL